MNVDPGNDEVRDAFRHAYQHLTDQVPVSAVEWPLLPSIAFLDRPAEPQRWGVTAAVSLLLLGAAFFGGWFFAPESSSPATDPFAAQDEIAAVAVEEGIGYPSHSEAAIAAAISGRSGLVDPQVTRAVVIFADEETVDLRVEVQADEFCYWFGVVGRVEDGGLAWRGGPALGCDD